jgi:ribosomal protein S12 methylthiotransferase RimO
MMAISVNPREPGRVRTAAVRTLGCARNEVDSEQLAGTLETAGWTLVDPDAETSPEVVLVNTCGFVETAKKDSVDQLLTAADTGATVVAVGCLAQRYGAELAESMPEVDAVLGFDDYPELPARLEDTLAGRRHAARVPTDRRGRLPVVPLDRPEASLAVEVPGHGWVPTARKRLTGGPAAPLKIASGCDRHCAFCAIPSFRGAFVSRPPAEILDEAAWLAEAGVRELYLVSENSTSYGKDLPRSSGGGPDGLARLLGPLAAVPGIERVRLSYLQPAETRPDLLAAIVTTPGVANYFDLSFQHGSAPVLRRMRRFGGTDEFLALCGRIRELAPEAGVRTNVIVGFPGETEEDLAELKRLLVHAGLDAIGVFGYSDEDGTEAHRLTGKLDTPEIRARVAEVSSLVDELTVQRAEARVGEEVLVLAERRETGACGEASWVGRAEHQAPGVDGECMLTDSGELAFSDVAPGEMVRAVVTGVDGVDLRARPLAVHSRSGR